MVDWKGVSDVEGLAAVVVETLSEAHENLAQAQVTSRQRGEGVYGQIWRSLCHDLAVRLRAQRLDVQVIKPAGVPYELPVLGDAILFPWRPAGGHTPMAIAFGTSATRQRLWRQPLSHDLLPLEMAEADGRDGHPKAEHLAEQTGEGEVAGLASDLTSDLGADLEGDVPAEVFAEAKRQHLRVVIVAMTSDARRLRCIEWGEAELDGDGVLQWSPETLYAIDDVAAPVSTSTETCSDGEAPTPGVTLKPKAEPESTDGTSAAR